MNERETSLLSEEVDHEALGDPLNKELHEPSVKTDLILEGDGVYKNWDDYAQIAEQDFEYYPDFD